jgi:hypothetical protein
VGRWGSDEDEGSVRQGLCLLCGGGDPTPQSTTPFSSNAITCSHVQSYRQAFSTHANPTASATAVVCLFQKVACASHRTWLASRQPATGNSRSVSQMCVRRQLPCFRRFMVARCAGQNGWCQLRQQALRSIPCPNPRKAWPGIRERAVEHSHTCCGGNGSSWLVGAGSNVRTMVESHRHHHCSTTLHHKT